MPEKIEPTYSGLDFWRDIITGTAAGTAADIRRGVGLGGKGGAVTAKTAEASGIRQDFVVYGLLAIVLVAGLLAMVGGGTVVAVVKEAAPAAKEEPKSG